MLGSCAESDIGDAKDGAAFSAVVQGVHSENRDLGTSSARPPSGSDVLHRTSADSSAATRESLLGIPCPSYRGAPNWEERSSRSGAEGRRADHSRGSQQSAPSSHRQSLSSLDHGPKRRRRDEVAAQDVAGASSERPLKRHRGAPTSQAGSPRPGDESGRTDRPTASAQTERSSRYRGRCPTEMPDQRGVGSTVAPRRARKVQSQNNNLTQLYTRLISPMISVDSHVRWWRMTDGCRGRATGFTQPSCKRPPPSSEVDLSRTSRMISAAGNHGAMPRLATR